jgi:protease I
LLDAGATVELVSLRPGEIRAMDHLEQADAFPVDRTVDEVTADDYDFLVLPGGVNNPDKLRMNDRAVAFVRSLVESGKPVGVICHGAWTLVEAGVVGGRTLTSYPSVKTDIRNAGGNWVDEELHDDGQIVSSRRPADLDAFCAGIVRRFRQGATSVWRLRDKAA